MDEIESIFFPYRKQQQDDLFKIRRDELKHTPSNTHQTNKMLQKLESIYKDKLNGKNTK